MTTLINFDYILPSLKNMRLLNVSIHRKFYSNPPLDECARKILTKILWSYHTIMESGVILLDVEEPLFFINSILSQSK